MKTFLILPIFLIFVFNFHAQDNAGFYFGLNMANLRGDVGGSAKAGLLIGIACSELEIANHFYIEPDLQYSQQGYQDNGNIVSGGVLNGKTKIDYINLAANFKYYKGLAKFYIGPQLGYLINAAREPVSGSEIDLKNGFSDIDFSVNAGFEVCPSGTIFLRAEYNFGLYNIAAESNKKYFNKEVMHSVFSACIGFRIG